MAKRQTFFDEFRLQLKECGVSRYRISKDTGITEASLSRFVNGLTLLNESAVNTLAEYLKLHVTKGR